MKKQITRLVNLRAIAAALLVLLAFPVMAGTAVGFDANPAPQPEDPDKYKTIIEDADPVGTYWRVNRIPGYWRRSTFYTHGVVDNPLPLLNPFNRLPAFVWSMLDPSALDPLERDFGRSEAQRNRRRD